MFKRYYTTEQLMEIITSVWRSKTHVTSDRTLRQVAMGLLPKEAKVEDVDVMYFFLKNLKVDLNDGDVIAIVAALDGYMVVSEPKVNSDKKYSSPMFKEHERCGEYFVSEIRIKGVTHIMLRHEDDTTLSRTWEFPVMEEDF